jgi:predicted metal-dependent hydrolase
MSASVLHLDDLRVPVETGGSSRKAKLTIEADGSLRLRAAKDVATDELRQFLASKRDWIYRKLAEKEVLQHEPVTKELVDGEGFLYLGRSHRLKIDDADGTVRLERGRLILPRSLAEAGEAHLIAWYCRCGEGWLRPRVKSWAERLRVTPGAIEVADLGHKWGSATTGRRVRIHWTTLQLSPSLVDYVLAHELAHLREAHHGPAFWQLLARVMPDYDERKRELAQRGAALWFGGVVTTYDGKSPQ